MPRRVSALAGGAGSICELNALIGVCRACPRLVSWREEVAVVSADAFAGGLLGAPGAEVGSKRPRLLILGLAPAAQGQPDWTNVHRRSVGRSALCSTA